MMWLEREYVERIRAEADWRVVLSQLGIEGQSAGDEYRALCPFHEETQPSFYFHSRRGVFYCHGCGCRGDGFALVMRREGKSFPEAVEWVAAECGVEGVRGGRESLLADLAAYYHWWLWRSDVAQQYLVSRGITHRELWQALCIGYAPGGRRAQNYLRTRGYAVETIESTGLQNRRGLDVFFQRLTFPLYEGGEVANLYGRNLRRAFPHMYLPGSRNVLLGFDQAKTRPRAILVEGLFDFLTLRQWGYQQAVTGLSANLSTRQLHQLRQAAWQELLLAFDNDASGAGHRAALSLVQNLSDANFDIRLVALPQGCDVNDCLVKDHFTRPDFDKLLEGATRC